MVGVRLLISSNDLKDKEFFFCVQFKFSFLPQKKNHYLFKSNGFDSKQKILLVGLLNKILIAKAIKRSNYAHSGEFPQKSASALGGGCCI